MLVRREFEHHQKQPFFIEQESYPHCSVLVGFESEINKWSMTLRSLGLDRD